jgi:hypothetical protein
LEKLDLLAECHIKHTIAAAKELLGTMQKESQLVLKIPMHNNKCTGEERKDQLEKLL